MEKPEDKIMGAVKAWANLRNSKPLYAGSWSRSLAIVILWLFSEVERLTAALQDHVVKVKVPAKIIVSIGGVHIPMVPETELEAALKGVEYHMRPNQVLGPQYDGLANQWIREDFDRLRADYDKLNATYTIKCEQFERLRAHAHKSYLRGLEVGKRRAGSLTAAYDKGYVEGRAFAESHLGRAFALGTARNEERLAVMNYLRNKAALVRTKYSDIGMIYGISGIYEELAKEIDRGAHLQK